jgi:hypothetical protein
MVNALPGETQEALIARTQPSFRRGVLAAADIFDNFTKVVVEVMREPGHFQMPPLDTLDRYAAYARFRFEFTKRMYDTKYGIAAHPHPPVAGAINVFSVDPSGILRIHGKHL